MCGYKYSIIIGIQRNALKNNVNRYNHLVPLILILLELNGLKKHTFKNLSCNKTQINTKL